MRPSVQVILKLPCTPILQRQDLIKFWHWSSEFSCWKVLQVIPCSSARSFSHLICLHRPNQRQSIVTKWWTEITIQCFVALSSVGSGLPWPWSFPWVPWSWSLPCWDLWAEVLTAWQEQRCWMGQKPTPPAIPILGYDFFPPPPGKSSFYATGNPEMLHPEPATGCLCNQQTSMHPEMWITHITQTPPLKTWALALPRASTTSQIAFNGF